MTIGARVDQYGIDAKAITGALHRTFHDVSNTELLANFAQIALGPGLVLTHARVANDFQSGYLGQIGKDLILDSIGEVSVVLIVAQAFEGQYRDRFVAVR